MSQRQEIIDELRLILGSSETNRSDAFLSRELELIVAITEDSGTKYEVKGVSRENDIKQAYIQWAENLGVSIVSLTSALITSQVKVLKLIAEELGYVGTIDTSQLKSKIILLTYIRENPASDNYLAGYLSMDI
jgi:hypothetical protein